MSAQTFTHLVQRFCGTGAVLRFESAPEHCPVCGHHVEPRPLVAHSVSPNDQLLEFAFQCPRFSCRRLFVGEYALQPDATYTLMATAAPAFGAEDMAYSAPWQANGL